MLGASRPRRIARGMGRERGFSLPELIAVIITIGSLTTVAVPVYTDLRGSARQGVILNISAAFAGAAKQAKASWMVNGTGTGAQLNVPGYGGGTLDFSDAGYPAGTSVASTAATGNNPSNANCVEIANALVPTVRVTATTYPAPGYHLYAYSGGGTVSHCIYYLLKSDGTYDNPGGPPVYRYFYFEVGSTSSSGYPRGTVVSVDDPISSTWRIHYPS